MMEHYYSYSYFGGYCCLKVNILMSPFLLATERGKLQVSDSARNRCVGVTDGQMWPQFHSSMCCCPCHFSKLVYVNFTVEEDNIWTNKHWKQFQMCSCRVTYCIHCPICSADISVIVSRWVVYIYTVCYCLTLNSMCSIGAHLTLFWVAQ